MAVYIEVLTALVCTVYNMKHGCEPVSIFIDADGLLIAGLMKPNIF